MTTHIGTEIERMFGGDFTPRPPVGKCADCGEDMWHRAKRCDACRERAEASTASVRAWTQAVPARYAWCAFEAPELGGRVHDASAIAKAREAAASLERVTLIGPAGTGKTVLACAIARAVAATGARCAFVEARTLASARAQHGLGHGEAPAVRDAIRAPVLVIDDVGSEAANPQSAIADVIHERHAWARPTIVTCALNVEGVKGRYGDGVARRLFEGVIVIAVKAKGGPR